MGSRATAARREAARLTRSRARTFYLASLFLPLDIRRDVHVMYAYYRTIDDLVDEPPSGFTRTDILEALDGWGRVINGEGAGQTDLMSEVVRVAGKRGIPRSYLAMVIEGARSDLDFRCMESWESLYDYSVLVAGSVGMVMSHVLGASKPEAITAACDLGVAMQVTNVLRDVAEDQKRGRVYLPLTVMERHGCSLEMTANGTVTSAFREVMIELSDHAREYFRRGSYGIRYLPARSQYSVYLAASLYAAILDKIEREDFDVFSRRAHLGTREKWAAAAPLYVSHRRLHPR